MNKISISSLILVASILLTSPWHHLAEADLISDVCTGVRDPTACNNALRSDPRSRGADLFGLGDISIDQSEAAIKAAIPVAKSAGNKPSVTKCVSSLNNAVGSIDQSRGALKRRDIDSFGNFASATQNNVKGCDDASREGTTPVTLKQALRNANDDLAVLLNIVGELTR